MAVLIPTDWHRLEKRLRAAKQPAHHDWPMNMLSPGRCPSQPLPTASSHLVPGTISLRRSETLRHPLKTPPKHYGTLQEPRNNKSFSSTSIRLFLRIASCHADRGSSTTHRSSQGGLCYPMTHSVWRSSMDSCPRADPANSIDRYVAPATPISPMICRMMSCGAQADRHTGTRGAAPHPPSRTSHRQRLLPARQLRATLGPRNGTRETKTPARVELNQIARQRSRRQGSSSASGEPQPTQRPSVTTASPGLRNPTHPA